MLEFWIDFSPVLTKHHLRVHPCENWDVFCSRAEMVGAGAAAVTRLFLHKQAFKRLESHIKTFWH